MSKCKQGSTRIFAEAFERLLYAQASSIEDHANSESLDTRLNAIFLALVQRRSRKCLNRRRALWRKLGHEKYKLLDSLLQDLDKIRLGRASCRSTRCTAMANQKAALAPPLPKLQKMPDAVRNLFFRTRLMKVKYGDPISKSEELLPVDWDELIKEAEKHVRDYHAWCAAEASTSCTVTAFL
jgi:hypothetical protein